MKTCPKCGKTSEDQFDSCWKCSTPLDFDADTLAPTADRVGVPQPTRRMAFEMFRATFSSWESLFSDAAAFATGVGPGNLVNISHSEDKGDGVVVVWYWTE